MENLNIESYSDKMKKRNLKVVIGIIFFLISLTSFFAKILAIEVAFSKIILTALILILGIFSAYAAYGLENKTWKTYVALFSALLILLGLLPLILELKLISSDYILAITVPIVLYKIILLFGSAFTIVDGRWK